jgi:hypothetical protein
MKEVPATRTACVCLAGNRELRSPTLESAPCGVPSKVPASPFKATLSGRTRRDPFGREREDLDQCIGRMISPSHKLCVS